MSVAPRRSQLLLPVALVAMVAVLFYAGAQLRESLGLELSVDSVRAWVDNLGWLGPATLVGLIVFRVFLVMPSYILLTVGGLLFGATTGTLVGSAGVIFSALMAFGMARIIGGEWIRPRLGDGFRAVEARLERAGVWLVGLVTAHPLGPMSAFHWASGFSRITLGSFALVVVPAALFRAGAYSLFGAALADFNSLQFLVATLALLTATALPLAHSPTRARLFGRTE